MMLALVFALVFYMLYQKTCAEGFTDSEPSEVPSPGPSMPIQGTPAQDAQPATQGANIRPYTGDSNTMDLTHPESAEINLGTACGGANSQFISSNLLPKDDPKLDPSFTEFSPAALKGQNFIDANRYYIGTQSQSLRNANLQLRSEPPNPQQLVCPWSQSTISPDAMRPNLEIGTGACS